MDAFEKLTSLAGAAVLALTLSAGPVLAVEETPDDAATEQAEEGGDPAETDKIQLTETAKDRVGLIMLGFLGAVTVGGVLTANRQLKGRRPQATGEFRWR